ncbi:MAG: acyl carrier protein [Alphaproteobacteria bacterium]|nr:acyl carrier protein [Alphaproteobacteria bacterium]MBU1552210.1 acyl carrier protein [Alphaproteobacteria bacterium]MBU2336880.1 acyl carrier protein [Alphaproteobacteria bacterium]MBU2389637.1 acyl carrier protein [Alphaproteobacteria bacterium]
MIFDQNTLLAYVRDDLEIKDVGLNTPLFSSGLLDSVSMVGLLGFIEQASGMVIRTEDVTLENFDTPARILAFAQATV